jgi:hypothetical protein
MDNLKYADRRNLSRNLDSSFLSVDERGNIRPKTPEAALVAAQAYLFTMQPTPRDPREHMHRAVLQGLGLVGDKLIKQETKHHVVMEEPTGLDPHIKTSRHTITIVLGTEAEVDIHDLHHQGTITAHVREEAEDPIPKIHIL